MEGQREEAPFLVRWIVAVTLGETLGFAFIAAVGASLASSAAPAEAVYPVMIAAGAVEGACLGTGQVVGFGKRQHPPRASWIAVTACGAALAWSIGMIPSTMADFRLDNSAAVVVTAFGAILLLTSIPVLQWLVLRRWIRPALFWIPANIAGWAFGILWTLAPSPFIDEHTAPRVIAAVFVTSGLLMALTVAAVTAFAARKAVRIARLRENGDVHKLPSAARA